MATGHRGLAFAAALLSLACEPSRLRETLQNEQRQTEAEIERKLVELDQRLERLRARARSAEHARTDAWRQLQEMERRSGTLRHDLLEAQRHGERALTETLESIDRTMEELEDVFGLSEAGEPEV